MKEKSRTVTYGDGIRMATIMDELHRRPFGWTMDDMTKTLGVSERTIRRYIQALKENFSDENGEDLVRFKGGVLRLSVKEPPLTSTAYQLISLNMATALMKFLEGTVLKDGAQDVVDKLRIQLKGKDAERLRDFQKKFYYIADGPKDYSEQDEILDEIITSLVYQRIIRVFYDHPHLGRRTHIIMPLTLLMYKRGIYLIAMNRQEKVFYLAVERITGVERIGENFVYPKDYSPEKFNEGVFGIMAGDKEYKVEVVFDAEIKHNVLNRRWHPSQETKELKNGDVLIKMRVKGIDEVLPWVLSYGSLARVKTPAVLRKIVETEIKGMREIYGI